MLKQYKLFQDFFPANADHYCYDLWVKYKFSFKITRKRFTKLGDYTFDPRINSHTITINGDLNKYSFLITYLHEVAHLVAHERNKRRISPHGKEWKMSFKELMEPVLSDLVFPGDVMKPLKAYLKNPMATTHSFPSLAKALRNYDENNLLIGLHEVSLGSKFQLRNRLFEKELVKRTRSLCRDLTTGRKYLISELALVKVVE